MNTVTSLQLQLLKEWEINMGFLIVLGIFMALALLSILMIEYSSVEVGPNEEI